MANTTDQSPAPNSLPRFVLAYLASWLTAGFGVVLCELLFNDRLWDKDGLLKLYRLPEIYSDGLILGCIATTCVVVLVLVWALIVRRFLGPKRPLVLGATWISIVMVSIFLDRLNPSPSPEELRDDIQAWFCVLLIGAMVSEVQVFLGLSRDYRLGFRGPWRPFFARV